MPRGKQVALGVPRWPGPPGREEEVLSGVLNTESQHELTKYIVKYSNLESKYFVPVSLAVFRCFRK